jgi:hypothetical protein
MGTLLWEESLVESSKKNGLWIILALGLRVLDHWLSPTCVWALDILALWMSCDSMSKTDLPFSSIYFSQLTNTYSTHGVLDMGATLRTPQN